MYKKKALSEIRHKLKIFAEVKTCGNVSFVCRRYGISRDTYYRWKRQYEALGEAGLIIKSLALKILKFALVRQLKKHGISGNPY